MSAFEIFTLILRLLGAIGSLGLCYIAYISLEKYKAEERHKNINKQIIVCVEDVKKCQNFLLDYATTFDNMTPGGNNKKILQTNIPNNLISLLSSLTMLEVLCGKDIKNSNTELFELYLTPLLDAGFDMQNHLESWFELNTGEESNYKEYWNVAFDHTISINEELFSRVKYYLT